VKRGQQWLSRQGYVPGGFPPRGYVAVQERIGERADGRPRFGIRWVPDPELAPPVIQAWQMRAQGASYHKIQQATGLYKSLNCWTTFFANTAYRGVVTYGQVEISIPPLVDEATWQAVQARRVPRGHSRKGKPWNEEHPRRASSTYLLSGLLYCGLCGSAMSGSRSYKWRHYICTRRKRRRDCPAPRVGADKLEEAIITCLRQEILTSEHITTLLATINAELDSGRGEVQAERMQIEEKLRKANQAISRLLDAIEARGRSGAIEERLKVREQERDQLELHHKELLLREQQNTFYIAPEDLAQLLDDLRRELLAAAPEDRRNALRALIHRVEITRGEVRLFYPVPFEQTGI
jgi:site-specific DNA recombinase